MGEEGFTDRAGRKNMKKMKVTMVAGAGILLLCACAQNESAEEQKEGQLIIERIDDEEELPKPQSADPAKMPEIAGEDAPEADEKAQTEEVTDAGMAQYEAFLKNEIGVANPYVEGMELTVMDDKNYESEFEDAQKKYAYVDVNADDNPELIFKISANPSELMYILGMCDNELVCFDVFETHTKNIAFGVYDYGLVWEVRDYDGFEMTFYSYTEAGQQMEARRLTEKDGADLASYEGEEPEWIEWSPSLAHEQ